MGISRRNRFEVYAKILWRFFASAVDSGEFAW